MKTNKLKLFALVATLLTSSLAFAEEVQEQTQWHVGDTILVKQSTKKYLTGEEPSKWVHFVEHTIQQVGGKRFPNGILLRGIYSWVGADDITKKTSDELSKRAEVIEQLSDDEKKALDRYAQKIGATVIKQEAVEEEPVVEPEPAPAPEPTPAPAPKEEVVEEPVAEPVVEEPVAEPVQEEVKVASNLDAMHRFSIGVRGGVASLLHDANAMGNWKAGFDALLDLQYAYYFGAHGRKVNPGILTGVSLGWAQSGLASSVDENYFRIDESNGPEAIIKYTVTADEVKENDGQLQLEIPVMFTMLTEKGFFLNVGPKLVVPVFSHYNQSITNPNVVAEFREEGVVVENEVITGLLQENQLNTKGKWATSKVNVMLTAELGWEWLLKNNHSIGLGVFANYSIYDLYDNDIENKQLINVGRPVAGGAPVNVFSATDTYAEGLGYFDCGLKFVYHFNFR